MEQITDDDLRLLEKYENRLDKLEEMIQKGDVEAVPGEVSAIRSVISDLKLHYGQLLDLTQEFEEDENDFFEEKNLRYFGMYTNRINSLMAITGSIYDHCIQIRELLKATLEAKQNRLMAILTVIATIFMPLTLIAGWYGMNFKFMPELQYKYSYPIVIGVCIVIVISCIYFFKKSKWL